MMPARGDAGRLSIAAARIRLSPEALTPGARLHISSDKKMRPRLIGRLSYEMLTLQDFASASSA